jgi:hypothetical protein
MLLTSLNNNRIFEIFCDNYVMPQLDLIQHTINTSTAVDIMKRFFIIITTGTGVSIPLYLSYLTATNSGVTLTNFGNFIIFDCVNNATSTIASPISYAETTVSPKPFIEIQIGYIAPSVALTPVPSFYAAYNRQSGIATIGGVTSNAALTSVQSGDRFVLNASGPKVTLTRLNPADARDNACIDNLFTPTVNAYTRFKGIVHAVTPLFGGSSTKPHTKPHTKTRNNRKQFKNTRKNNK